MNKKKIENDYKVEELLKKIEQQEKTIIVLEKSIEKEKIDNKKLRQEIENLKKENIKLQNKFNSKQFDKRLSLNQQVIRNKNILKTENNEFNQTTKIKHRDNIPIIERENKKKDLINTQKIPKPEISKNKKKENSEIFIKNKESENYVKKLDIKKTLDKINLLTNSNINENNLIEAQLNNKEEYKKINTEINESCNKLMTESLTPKEYLNKITQLGTNIKNKIIYETYNEPDQFIPLKETEKSDPNSTLFIEGILAKALINNNITVAIEKTTKNNDLSLTLLQLISSGEVFQKVINVTYDYGEDRNIEILSNEEEKTKFINLKRKEISTTLNIPIERIELTNLRYGSIKATLIIKDYDLDEEDLIKIAKDKAIKNIEFKALFEGCLISPYMFDSNGDRSSGWGINQSRGPPHHLQKYYPPLEWNGYGLRVTGKYDNGDDTWLNYSNVEGEWYIAYHGTSGLNVPNKIIEEGFKGGSGQWYFKSKNINPLSQNEFPKCGYGVYLTPVIEEAQKYSKGINFDGVDYYLVFMCRVNPYKVRFAEKNDPPYWIVSGDLMNDKNGKKYSDEIRPYRILLKKIKLN